MASQGHIHFLGPLLGIRRTAQATGSASVAHGVGMEDSPHAPKPSQLSKIQHQEPQGGTPEDQGRPTPLTPMAG